MKIIREGVLQLGKNPNSNSSKDWKAYLFVLKHYPDTRKSVLDYYKDLGKRWQKQERRGSIELWPYFQVSLAHNCSYRFPLQLTIGEERTCYLAANSFEVMNKWCNSLQTQSYLVKSNKDGYREFFVVPVQSISTSLIGATGDCILAFTPQRRMVCALLATRQIVGVWPYNSLRKYTGGKKQFGFIAGRRSPRGEGEFTFHTNQGEDMYLYLERMIRYTSMASRPELEDSLPPDPTRSETPVPSSESDDEAESSVSRHNHPPGPPKLPQRQSIIMDPLPVPPPCMTPPPFMDTPTHGASGTEVSDTSPAYFVNAGANTRPTQYTGNNPNHPPNLPLNMRPVELPMTDTPPGSHGPPPGSHDPLPEDDLYSHATHEVPAHPRSAHRGLLTGEGSTYQGLVRTDSTKSAVGAGRPPLVVPAAVVRGTGMADTPPTPDDLTYDVAFPPNYRRSLLMTPIGEEDYGSMGNPEEQRRQLVEKRLIVTERKLVLGGGAHGASKLRNDPADSVDGVESANHDGDDADLTCNPLYASNERVFSPKSSIEFSGQWASNLYIDPSDDTVANPVYGEHTPRMGTGSAGNVGVVSGDSLRSVSPIHSSAANPMYAGRGDVGAWGRDQEFRVDGSDSETNSIVSSGQDTNSLTSSNRQSSTSLNSSSQVLMSNSDGLCSNDQPPNDTTQTPTPGGGGGDGTPSNRAGTSHGHNGSGEGEISDSHSEKQAGNQSPVSSANTQDTGVHSTPPLTAPANAEVKSDDSAHVTSKSEATNGSALTHSPHGNTTRTHGNPSINGYEVLSDIRGGDSAGGRTGDVPKSISDGTAAGGGAKTVTHGDHTAGGGAGAVTLGDRTAGGEAGAIAIPEGGGVHRGKGYTFVDKRKKVNNEADMGAEMPDESPPPPLPPRMYSNDS